MTTNTNNKSNLDYNIPNRRKDDFFKPVKNFTDEARQITLENRLAAQTALENLIKITKETLQ